MKKLLAVVLAAMMVLSIVSFAAAEDVTHLTIVTWDANTTGYLTAQKEAYEASHPGVVIDYIDVSSQDYENKVSTMLAAGDTSDIIMIKTIPGLMNWNDAGYALSLNDYIAASNYDLSGYVGMDAQYNYGGEQVALAFRSDFWVLFYNKDLFDQAGVAYPTNDMTWGQFVEAATAIKAAVPDAWGAHFHTWLSAVANWAVCDGVNTLIDGEYSDLAPYYEMVLGLQDAGVIQTYAETRAAGLHYSGAFGNGNIAMMPMGYWYVATLIQNQASGSYEQFNWGISAVPHADDVQAGSSFGNLTGAMINSNSTQPDAAWDYIAWLCGEEGSLVTASTGNRPAWVSEGVAAAMSSVEGFPSDETSVGALLPSYVAIEIPGDPNASAISTILNETHSMIMNGECSIEDGIADNDERVQDLLAE